LPIRFLKFGKIKDSGVLKQCQEYQKRISAFHDCDLVFVKENAAGGASRTGNVWDGKDYDTSCFIVLDERGSHWTNPELAHNLRSWIEDRRFKRLVFVIGDAFGVDESLKARAHASWCLSKLVFTNEHATLLAHEQIYRSLMLLHGRSYHHD
jgi:23S rRNA (pseudouridine1915-N3)-methyltransferase